MSTIGRRRVVGAITQLRGIWQELDYAQHRSLELRTGLSFERPARDATRDAEIEHLEALYDLPAHDEISPHTGRAPANARYHRPPLAPPRQQSDKRFTTAVQG